MKIVIPGGTGQVGTILARAFHADKHEVGVLSRRASPAPWRVVKWDAEGFSDWVSEFEGADAVINLTGRSVNCRYGAANRREIMDSRVKSTRVVGQAIAKAKVPPRVWLQMSTATIYEHRYDAPNDEATGILGGDEPNAPDTWRFSIDVAKTWELTATDAVTPDTRKILLRTAMVMSPDHGGVFDVLLRLVRFGLGGKAGDGKQFVSWIHHADVVRAMYFLIEHSNIHGPVNICSLNPLPYAEFMRALREAWGIRIGLPAMKWMIEIATFFMRSESELVLKSRRVIPGRLKDEGFEFRHPQWREAARELCSEWKSR